MRLLITGGSGYVGRDLVVRAADDYEICYTWLHHDPLSLPQGHQVDIRRQTAVSALFATFQPDIVIHTAGSNRGQDLRGVIVDGTRHVVTAAAAVGARLIHFSTDSIFNGRTGAPYAEPAHPSPINEYGRAKSAAEEIVRQHPDHVILRTSLVYGLHEMDHGTRWMVDALRAGQPVTLFTNQRRNPIWVKTLTAACFELAQHTFTGTLHVAGSQVLTRAAFGLKMLDWWRIGQRETLSLGPATDETWPLDCEFDLRLATAVLSTPLPGVDIVLERERPLQNMP